MGQISIWIHYPHVNTLTFPSPLIKLNGYPIQDIFNTKYCAAHVKLWHHTLLLKVHLWQLQLQLPISWCSEYVSSSYISANDKPSWSLLIILRTALFWVFSTIKVNSVQNLTKQKIIATYCWNGMNPSKPIEYFTTREW